MPKHSNMNESEVLNYVFREVSTLDAASKEKNINTYYAIKHHIPSELYKTGELMFNYNKGVNFIVAQLGDIQLFKIPNDTALVEMICPPRKDYIDSLGISDFKKDAVLSRFKDTKAKVWYAKLTPEEVLCYSSKNWEGFGEILKSLCK